MGVSISLSIMCSSTHNGASLPTCTVNLFKWNVLEIIWNNVRRKCISVYKVGRELKNKILWKKVITQNDK